MSFSSRRGKHSFSIRDASATSDVFDDDDDGWVVSSSSIRRKNASINKVDAVEDDDFDDVFFVVVVVFPSSTVVVVDLVVLLLALVVLEVVLAMVVVVFFIVRDSRETQLCGTTDAPCLGGKNQKKAFRVSFLFFFCARAASPQALAQEDTRPSFRHLNMCECVLQMGR